MTLDYHNCFAGPDKMDQQQSRRELNATMRKARIDRPAILLLNEINPEASFRSSNNYIAPAIKKSPSRFMRTQLDPNCGNKTIRKRGGW